MSLSYYKRSLLSTNFVQLTTLESEKQLILDENTRLAELNLTREPELAEQRIRINDLSTQGKELCLQVQDMLADSSKHIRV